MSRAVRPSLCPALAGLAMHHSALAQRYCECGCRSRDCRSQTARHAHRAHFRGRIACPAKVASTDWHPRRCHSRSDTIGQPANPGKIALGQRLFFERRLSADGTVACSNCHDPKQAFTDGRPVSIGIKGHVGQRNAPTILNALYNKTQFWDGRVRTLEEQAAQPIVNPSEMGHTIMPFVASSITRQPSPTCCVPSRPMNERNFRLILHSIISSPGRRTRSTRQPSVAGNFSTPAAAATNVMR